MQFSSAKFHGVQTDYYGDHPNGESIESSTVQRIRDLKFLELDNVWVQATITCHFGPSFITYFLSP